MMFKEYNKESFEENYGQKYSTDQLTKFMFRKGNHWAERLRTVFDLVAKLEFPGKNVLDIGTSIGTYAIEFASRGFNAQGIDLDPESIKIAKVLAKKHELSITYKAGDISERSNFKPGSFDIICAMDIIEHLPPPILQKTISNCHYWLREGGYLIYHTFPMKYHVIFHGNCMWYPLVPFCMLPDKYFSRLVELDYKIYNLIRTIIKGESYREHSKRSVHCNLQTKDSLINIILKNGFFDVYNQVCTTEERFKKGLNNMLFKNKEFFQKDMYGVAWKPYNNICD